MRTMYDSVKPSRIPRDAEMVAGYVNGPYKWADTDWALFPDAVHVGIAVRASYNGGEVLDVETGDASPVDAPGWVEMRRATGVDPSVYCSESLWTTVAREFNRQGVVAPHYWIAHYDGNAQIPIGAVAKQYRNTADWDISAVSDFWPGIDTVITPPTKEDFAMERQAGSGTTNIPCNGNRQFFCQISGASTGEHVDGHIWYVKDTPPGTALGAYAGDRAVHFDADRPGPISLPENVRAVAFTYTATAPFTAWCA